MECYKDQVIDDKGNMCTSATVCEDKKLPGRKQRLLKISQDKLRKMNNANTSEKSIYVRIKQQLRAKGTKAEFEAS